MVAFCQGAEPVTQHFILYFLFLVLFLVKVCYVIIKVPLVLSLTKVVSKHIKHLHTQIPMDTSGTTSGLK